MTRLYLREAHITYRRTDVKLTPRTIYASDAVVTAVREHIGSNIAESLVVLALDAGHRVIGLHEAARGGVDGCLMQAADVFRYPLIAGAAACIVAHNHPSGRVEPSQSDVVLTEKLFAAGKLLGLPLLDHVIVTDTASFSFLDRGLMPTKAGHA